MTRVDCHLHVDLRGFSARRLVEWLDEHEMDYGWVHSWEEDEPADAAGYRALPIESIAAAHAAYPDRIVPFYAPDPRGSGSLERLEEWVSRGVAGCGELKVNARWDSDEVGRLLEKVGELGLPLLFHMQRAERIFQPETRFEHLLRRLAVQPRFFGVTGKMLASLSGRFGPLRGRLERMSVDFPGYLLDFASLEARLAEYPEVPFIGHGPLFWSELWRADSGSDPRESATYRLMARYPNLHADISAGSGFEAIRRDRDFTRQFFVDFQDRVLYGTDNYGYDWFGLLESLQLPPGVGEKILGGTAHRLTRTRPARTAR